MAPGRGGVRARFGRGGRATARDSVQADRRRKAQTLSDGALMPARARRRSRVAGLILAPLAVVLAALALFPLRGHVDQPAYDLLSTIATPLPSTDIVVIAIDEPSFAEIGQPWPWPRTLHADLVKAVRAAGARVIGLDILFAEPSTPEADRALAEALGPDVVLASDRTVIDSAQTTQSIRIDPLPQFLERGAQAGVVAIELDRDGVLRRFPAFDDSFAHAVARKAGGPDPKAPEGALAPFRGGPRTYQTYSYHQALKPDEFFPAALKNKIVLVGLSTQTAANAASGGADAFATPFTARTGKLTAGVEAQATMIDALRSRTLVEPAPPSFEIAALALATLIGVGLARGGRVSWGAVFGAVCLAAAGVAASWVALHNFAYWLSPVPPALALMLVVGVDAAIDISRRRRGRREIARAFGRYLSPELVARLARDPDSLKLGGERRTLTILFCDVRGFTALAEGMKDDPERLTSLLNRLLGPLSDAVAAEGGTLDKYIGDCVMAFWNAPLDAPDHAERAVAAALKMLDAVKALNERLAAEDSSSPAFSIGIGINTGDCVVGNLGTSKRFDYTAIGEAVNLASRLESASRFYGVPLLIGGATAERAGGRFALVELDRIAVKGRKGGREVYTALGLVADEKDLEPVRTSQAAHLAAYRAREWDAAIRALIALKTAEPRLGPYADRMGGRIVHLKAKPPPADWDGVFTAGER